MSRIKSEKYAYTTIKVEKESPVLYLGRQEISQKYNTSMLPLIDLLSAYRL